MIKKVYKLKFNKKELKGNGNFSIFNARQNKNIESETKVIF